MKRKLYFFLERLEISKNERLSITILMGLFAILSTATLLYQPPLNYSEGEYERLEMFFREKSRASEEQRMEILARYGPAIPGNELTGDGAPQREIVSGKPGQGQLTGSGAGERAVSPDRRVSGAGTPGTRPAGQFADTTSSEESGSYENCEESPEACAGTAGLININTATAEELQQLPGIGPAYAGRILEWRAQNGRFTSIDQLIEISGIGEKRLENIRLLVTL